MSRQRSSVYLLASQRKYFECILQGIRGYEAHRVTFWLCLCATASQLGRGAQCLCTVYPDPLSPPSQCNNYLILPCWSTYARNYPSMLPLHHSQRQAYSVAALYLARRQGQMYLRRDFQGGAGLGKGGIRPLGFFRLERGILHLELF